MNRLASKSHRSSKVSEIGNKDRALLRALAVTVLNFANNVFRWTADWKGVHAVLDHLVKKSSGNMIPTGCIPAEVDTTEERIV